MATLKLSSPWVLFYREIEALFSEDPSVHVLYDADKNETKIYVENSAKAEALTKLLPDKKVYGNVTMKITVVPGNFGSSTLADTYDIAFDGNAAVAYTKTVQGILTNPIHYIVFHKKVVQFFTDDLGDIHGIRSCLYQDLANEIFEKKDGVFFCTDVKDINAGVGAPLGEWP